MTQWHNNGATLLEDLWTYAQCLHGLSRSGLFIGRVSFMHGWMAHTLQWSYVYTQISFSSSHISTNLESSSRLCDQIQYATTALDAKEFWIYFLNCISQSACSGKWKRLHENCLLDIIYLFKCILFSSPYDFHHPDACSTSHELPHDLVQCQHAHVLIVWMLTLLVLY